MDTRDFHVIDDLEQVMNDERRIAAMREGLLAGDVYIVKEVETKERIRKYREYLEGIGRGSLPFEPTAVCRQRPGQRSAPGQR